jgi:hypothetical protein
LKASDLIAAVFGGQTGLEKTGANGVERSEFFTVGEQGVTTFDFAAHGNQVVQTGQILVGQSHWHAQLPQIAVGAGDFDSLGIHSLYLMGKRELCLGSSLKHKPKNRLDLTNTKSIPKKQRNPLFI